MEHLRTRSTQAFSFSRKMNPKLKPAYKCLAMIKSLNLNYPLLVSTTNVFTLSSLLTIQYPPYPTNQLTAVFCNNCHPQQILPIKHVCKSKELSNSLVKEGDLSKWVRPEYTIHCGEINGGAKPFCLSFSVTTWTAFLRHYEPASELVCYYTITNQRH